MVAQPTAGTLGNRGLRSHTELDGHGAYIPVAQPVPYDLFQITAPVNRQNRKPGDPCHTLARDNAAHAAIAFQQNTRDEVRLMNGDGQIAGALAAEAGMKQQNYLAQSATTVAVAHALRGEGFDASEDGTGRGTPLVPVAPSLTATNDPSRSPQSSEVTQQVAAVYANTMTVRRLTPRECERLQGFPDDYTLIPWRKKQAEDCPDGPRYKALGNSMAVNCMAWIGERIAAYEDRHER
jgi:DNA (cytosine-5)-methyltransferase 1